MPIYLTIEELREITGRIRASAQIRWLRQQGFTVMSRADGKPLVSRSHFETKMDGLMHSHKSKEAEPYFSSL